MRSLSLTGFGFRFGLHAPRKIKPEYFFGKIANSPAWDAPGGAMSTAKLQRAGDAAFGRMEKVVSSSILVLSRALVHLVSGH